MVVSSSKRLWYGLAGGGIAIGVFIHYLRDEGQQVHTFKNPNFIPSVKWDSNWDRRDVHAMVKPPKNSTPEAENEYNENLEKAKPTATRHLILIRHGQYNLKGKEDKDRFLTALGREQAAYTGKRVKELNFQYDRIVQSTLLRAVETAGIISSFLPDVPLDSCDLLREGAPIPPEPPVGHWKPEATQFYIDGARLEAAFRKYFHRADASQEKDSYEILVCHANVIRYFVCRALQFPPEAWLRFVLHHCSLTRISIRPSGRVVAFGVGDCGHIPFDKIT